MARLFGQYHLLIIFAASMLVVIPMLLFGFPSGTVDLIHHIQLSLAYFDSIRQGVFVPDWVADENFGCGSVAVRFYPPLTHFVLALLRLVCGSWQSAFIVSFFIWS